MKGFSLLSFYCVFYVGVFLFINNGKSDKLDITYTKEELEYVLKSLAGSDPSSVPDFLFLDKESLQNYTKTKGPPRNRTEKRRAKRPKPRERSDAEITLEKALKRLKNNKSVGVITRWARLLEVILFEANFTNEIQECVAQKTLGIGFGENGCPSTPTTTTTTTTTTPAPTTTPKPKNRNSCRRRRRRRRNRFRNRRSRFRGDEKEEEDDDYDDDSDESTAQENFHQEDSTSDDLADYVNHPKNFGPVQTIDFERMRRSLTYTYEESETCYNEGAEGTTSDTIVLCNFCYKTINFGDTVLPQYANSIECVDSAPNCLGGDGSCTQKVVYYTFQKQTGEKEWESYQQPLNVSCECECLANSGTHFTSVGNSNF